MNEDQLKIQFALELIKCPSNPFKAACTVFPVDTAKAVFATREWVNDAFVIQTQKELIEESGELSLLPSKADLARSVWELAEDSGKNTEDRLKAYRLYAEVLNYIEKPTTNIQNNNITSNKVMIVRESSSADEWERKLIEQQSKLVDHASH